MLTLTDDNGCSIFKLLQCTFGCTFQITIEMASCVVNIDIQESNCTVNIEIQPESCVVTLD
jgi:hypothetical protein